jgi:polysaccharide export outer membrane protein
MCPITTAAYRAGVTHTAVQYARVLGIVVTFAVLSACSLSPGMRMVQPPTLPVSNTDDGVATGAEQIQITDITLATVQQERKALASGDSNDLTPLFGEAGPYRIGAGDVLQITVWDHPELAAALGQPVAPTRASDPGLGFVVDHEGNLQFPYVGTLHVRGDSAQDVQRKITAGVSRSTLTARCARPVLNPSTTFR